MVAEENPVAVCILPAWDRKKSAEVRAYGPRLRTAPAPAITTFEFRLRDLTEDQRRQLAAELEPVDRLLAADSRNAPARAARAAILQRFGLHTDAAIEYRRLADLWREVDWPRQLVHEEEDAERRVSSPRVPPEGGGKTYALVVGISRYPRLSEDQQLQFAHRDALMFADHLRSPRGGGLPSGQLELLTDERATTAAVRTGIADFLRARAGKLDTVVIFISAHGTVDERGAYVVTYDSDPEDLRTTALSMAEIQRLLEDEFTHVGRVLLYVDVCRAGVIGTIRHIPIGNVIERYLGGTQVQNFGLLASRAGEVSLEHERFGGGHGAFSYFLTRGLNGEADEDHDGRVTADELLEYVRTRVREATLKKQTPRDTGQLDSPWDILIRDVRLPGIALADWRPLDITLARWRGVAPETGLTGEFDRFWDALDQGRILPGPTGTAFDLLRGLQAKFQGRSEALLDLENSLLVALADRGQQVLLRYLQGDEVPQQRDDFADGERFYSAAMELDAGAWALQSRRLFCQGRVMIFDKRYSEAIVALERAARIDPEGAYTFNALGIGYLERGEYTRAVAAFHDAVRRAPHWSYPVHNLALALTEMGDYAGAVEHYREAMRLVPQAAYVAYNLGLVYQRLNRRNDAESMFLRAVANKPAAAEPYNALGFLKATSGKNREAETLYRQALERNPKLAAARHNLALLLARQPARLAEAIELWRQNLAEAPGFTASRVSLAETLTHSGRTAEAIGQYETLVRERPDFLSARLALAELLANAGRNEEAVQHLQEALRQKPGSAVVWERMGDVQMSRREHIEAAEAYRSALQAPADPKARKRIRAKLRLTGERP